MRSLSIDIPKFLTDFYGKMLLSNTRTEKPGIFFRFRREENQINSVFSLLNLVDVDTLSGCYHIKPSSLAMGGLVSGRIKTMGA